MAERENCSTFARSINATIHMGHINKAILRRSELLLGADIMERIASQKVIIFGIGGVGSWCAESLIRSGITQLTIVDSDRICITNVNRQLMATMKTIGRVKTDVLRERLLEINPNADITAIQGIYSPETREEYHLEQYDYIIDAIDSLKDKADLILTATRLKGVTLFSSMGAALKMDPTRIHVAEFWKVTGDPLARALRQRFKRDKQFPARRFRCVYSDELLTNRGVNHSCGTEHCMCPKVSETRLKELQQTEGTTTSLGKTELVNHEWCTSKAQINGTVAHITAIFGFTLAAQVIQDIYIHSEN